VNALAGPAEPAVTAGAETPLFSPPSIEMAQRADGCLMLRSADPLLAYPATVVHSLRASAASAPDHPLIRGPMVTPGYFGRPDLTAAAFDEDGFYRSGDAVEFARRDDPNAGLVFRGRIAEDFKLATGTFVCVGAVRTALLSALPVLSDAVITGEERDCVCALAWLNAAEARLLLGADVPADGELVVHEVLRQALAQGLADHNRAAGSAARIERIVVLARPPDLDAGELTDKGYINQRQVLKNRSALIELLYRQPPPDGVVIAGNAAPC
jgi:feruloyl-CoA synthase